MWHDIETDDDYLNFKMLIDSVYDTIIEQYDDAPLSFGVSGNWGSGKSSFILQLRDKFADNPDYVICDFNAWLYQGFEDSKVALLTAVSNELAKLDENETKEWKKQISSVISKIKKGKKLANAVVSIIPGLPVVLNKINEVGDQVLDISESLFCDNPNDSDITASIEFFRKEIETTLTATKKKLIVFKDSYANSMMQFLTLHYEEIAVVDLRYLNVPLSEYQIDLNDYQQALFLYNVGTFTDDQSMRKLAGC